MMDNHMFCLVYISVYNEDNISFMNSVILNTDDVFHKNS